MTEILKGKTALVTGAASGIGRASAIALAQAGANVVVADIMSEGGEATAKAIVDVGGKAEFIRLDVTCASEVKGAVDRAVSCFGRLDIAHNNAGVLVNNSLMDDAAEQVFDRVMDVNVKGIMLSMKYQISQMLQQESGVIINTASVMGLVGASRQWAYAASKHAVIGMTKAVAVEYAKRGIRVNAVCPASVRTPMLEGWMSTPEAAEIAANSQPIGRVANPEEIADTVVWLASDAASYITGTAIPVDGGYTAI